MWTRPSTTCPTYVYDLDDIEQEAERGRERRSAAVPAAERIIAAEVEAYERWQASPPLVPTIRLLRDRVLALVGAELERARELSPEQRERLSDALTAKILHQPLESLRNEAEEGTGAYYADAVRRLFGLEEEGG